MCGWILPASGHMIFARFTARPAPVAVRAYEAFDDDLYWYQVICCIHNTDSVARSYTSLLHPVRPRAYKDATVLDCLKGNSTTR